MTDHLPECEPGAPLPDGSFLGCICNQLRASYKRALDEAVEAAVSAIAAKTKAVMHSRYEHGDDLDDEYNGGWRDAMKTASGVAATAIGRLKGDADA